MAIRREDTPPVGSQVGPDGELHPAAGSVRGKPILSAFLEHLVRTGVVTRELACDAVESHRGKPQRDRNSVLDVLEKDFGITRDELYLEVARFYSFRVVDLGERSARRLSPGAVNRILSSLPESIYQLAMRCRVLPYETAENQPDKILVATPNPSDREVSEVARSLPFKKFEICYMREKDWSELWRQVSLDRQMNAGGEETAGAVLEAEDDRELDNQLEKEISRSQLISMVENILTDAVRVGASDIHIVPRAPRKTDIMFRTDGELSVWYTVEDIRAEAVVAVVKGRTASLDRFERLAAQDGAAQKQVDNQIIRFRMSVLPIISREITGKLESVVIRILRDADASVSLETIGFDPYSLRVFSEAIKKPHGLVILTGPTGSGKSTTLVAALRSVMDITKNTITVEDPVEYLIDGARQVKLNPHLGFDEAVRAILRHDPDIVMVGEIRDRTTADIAVKLSNTGHLTLSTLHTNDAVSAITRFYKMGVEPFLLAQSLNIVVAQRLVRKLCQRCRREAGKPDEQLLLRTGFTPEEIAATQFFEPVGCDHCVGGFKGRTAIHESLYVTSGIRSIIIAGGDTIDTDAIKQISIDNGMQTLRRSGICLVKRGVTTVDEILSTTIND